jgi:hypothetical protein
MSARPHRAIRLALLAHALLVLAGQTLAQPPGKILPLAVHDGRCEFVVPCERADAKYWLIIGSLSTAAQTHRVTVRSECTDIPLSLPLEACEVDRAWERRIKEQADRLEHARNHRPVPTAYRPVAAPPRRRTFHVFVGDGNFEERTSYVAVTGELRGLGRRCQVYVDAEYADLAGLQSTVDDAVAVFDKRIYKEASARFGQALDVDRDGRFTILFTSWLGRLSAGRVSVGGFVRGSDFYRDVQPPFGNRCDLLYLNTELKPGPHLHTILAHEYTHAILFSERIFGGYPGGDGTREEESWLNEGLAHLAEDLHGESWGNLDYRISAELSDPARYPLVVADYYGRGLWRTPGVRGAAYLFLRWCTDRHGPDLLRRLTLTGLCGVENLETATRTRFAYLFRQWSAAVVLAGTRESEGAISMRGIDLTRPLGNRLLCGPRSESLPLSHGSREINLAGTAFAACLLHSPTGKRSRVSIETEPDAQLQVTLIRLPDSTARLRLLAEVVPHSSAFRLTLTAIDSDVTLDGAAWERWTPTTSELNETSFRSDASIDPSVRVWFGVPYLSAGETRQSTLIPQPVGSGPWVIKVIGTDRAGHRVMAWTTLELLATAKGTDTTLSSNTTSDQLQSPPP